MVNVEVCYTRDMEAICPVEGGDWIDIAIPNNVYVQKGEYYEIPLGFSMAIPEGYEAHVLPRSSTFKKWGIMQANGMGIIDHTYCGPDDIWRFPAYATRNALIPAGTRIAQFRLVKNQEPVSIKVVATNTRLNRGGLGSTGESIRDIND